MKLGSMQINRELVVALGVALVLLAYVQFRFNRVERVEYEKRISEQHYAIAKLLAEVAEEHEAAVLATAENAKLLKTIKALESDCVPRASVRVIDDIPTVSMREKCLGFALAWKDALHILARMKKNLEPGNR